MYRACPSTAHRALCGQQTLLRATSSACCVLGFAAGLVEGFLSHRGHSTNAWSLLFLTAVASCQHIQTREVWISVKSQLKAVRGNVSTFFPKKRAVTAFSNGLI